MKSTAVVPLIPKFHQYWALDIPHAKHSWQSNLEDIHYALGHFQRNHQLDYTETAHIDSYVPGHDLMVLELKTDRTPLATANKLMEQVADKNSVAVFARNTQAMPLWQFLDKAKTSFHDYLEQEAALTAPKTHWNPADREEQRVLATC